ncbi:MAG: hypothetical protein RR804_22045, partial [Massilia sp.]
VTATLGTTGAGVHLVVPMERTLNGRFGINYYKHDFDKRSGGIDYDGDAKLQTFDALFDWYAFADTALRLTAGVVYNGNEVTAKARPNSNALPHQWSELQCGRRRHARWQRRLPQGGALLRHRLGQCPHAEQALERQRRSRRLLPGQGPGRPDQPRLPHVAGRVRRAGP